MREILENVPDLYDPAYKGFPTEELIRFCWIVFAVLLTLAVVFQAAIYIIRKRKGKAAPSFSYKTVLVSILMAVLFFGVWEGALQIRARSINRRRKFDYHTEMWTLRPNKKQKYRGIEFVSNSEGLREENVPPKEEGELRILCLGDSWTIGQGVEEDKIFVRLLEKKLKKEYPDKHVRVINGGMFGYSVLQGLNLFRKISPLYKPDVVIVCGFNYFANKEIAEYESVINDSGSLGTARAVLGKSLVYQCIKKTLEPFHKKPKDGKKGKISQELSMKLYARYADKLYKEFGRQDLEVIVFEHADPSLGRKILNRIRSEQGEDYVHKTADGNVYLSLLGDPGLATAKSPKMREFGGNLDYVSFFALVPNPDTNPEKWFFLEDDPTHPSERGHEAMADALTKIIIDRNLLMED